MIFQNLQVVTSQRLVAMQNLKPYHMNELHTPSHSLVCLAYRMALFRIFKAIIGYLENCGSLSYTDLQNGDTFHFTVSKKISCKYYHQSQQESLKFSEAVTFIVADTHFPKIWFLEALHFNIGNKFQQLFSLKWQLAFIIFKKGSASCLNMNSHSSLGILSSKNDVLWKWLVQLATQTIPQMFFLENNYTLVCNKSTLCIFVTQC